MPSTSASTATNSSFSMMKLMHRIFPLLLCLILGCTAVPGLAETETPAFTDSSASIRLDMTSDTLKQEVTVKTFVDGDTTHFLVPLEVHPSGVLKARYLAINTPESTGKIEEYGKAASRYTREKLEAAESIIIESDNGQWNLDSTGDRHLVWVWYKTADMDDYRNLNIELLEQGLAIANSAAQNRYGNACMQAIARGKLNGLNIHSGLKDPDFYYGEAVELTLKELRCNLDTYNGIKVAFSGVITMNDNNSVYIETHDPETDRYYGISVYYGFGLSGAGLDILSVGNEARIVGTVQYYEADGTWQVSGLTYRQMKPKDPGNIQKLSEGHSPSWTPASPADFSRQVTIATEDASRTCLWPEMAMATSVSMQGLTVTAAEPALADDGTDTGALILTCEKDGASVLIHTVRLPSEPADLVGKSLDVKGIVDFYDGVYQLKVFSADHVTVY